jgi:1,4-dihydroxy-2-naphthoyl-CoA synthase
MDNIVSEVHAYHFLAPKKVVIAAVPGWAVGGGHSLHVVCDMTLASKEHAILSKQMPM